MEKHQDTNETGTTESQETKEIVTQQETQAAEKTYTQKDIDAREASVKKAERAKLLKELGISDAKEIQALIDAKKAADEAAEAKEDIGKKLAKTTEAIAAREKELAEAQAKATKLEQSLLVRDYGATGDHAEMLTLFLATKVTDEKPFTEVAKEYFEANPITKEPDKPTPPERPGAEMGASGGTQPEADILKANFKTAKESRNYTEMTKIQRLANEKGISLS